MATDTLEPAAADIDGDYDFAQLDPANLMRADIGEQVEIPGREITPDPVTPDPPADDPLMQALGVKEPVVPAQPKTPDPVAPAKNEPVNMKNLRLAREAAEKERDTFKSQAETLAAKLADLEPRAKNYDTERQSLEQKLAEKERQQQEAQAALYRTDARQRPEWKETAQRIQAAAKEVEGVLALRELVESGLQVNPVVLLDPNNHVALNETVRVLQEAGRYTEAQKLITHNMEVNRMRADLRGIEERAATEATEWQTNSEAAQVSVLRAAREQLAQASPIYDPRSPQFMALPKESQDFLNEQIVGAENSARELLAAASKPEALLSQGYRMNLAMRLAQQGATNLQAQVKAQTDEITSLKAQIASYEKAAGGGPSASGGTSAARTMDPEDPAELARMLDPRNLKGFNGI